MRKVAPWPVDWLDPAEAVARRAAFVLAGGLELETLNESERIELSDSELLGANNHSQDSPGVLGASGTSSFPDASSRNAGLSMSQPGDWVDAEEQYSGRVDDIAIMTSGSPTQATRRLLHGAGLTLYATAFETAVKRINSRETASQTSSE